MCLALMTRISLFIILNLYLEEHAVERREGLGNTSIRQRRPGRRRGIEYKTL